MANKKPRDDSTTRTGRRPRLTATARAQAQRDALTRRVHKRCVHLLRYGPLPKPDEPRPSWENFPWAAFAEEIRRKPIRGVNRVTGLAFSK